MDQSKKIFEIIVSAFLLVFTLFLLYISFTTVNNIVVEGLTSMDFPRTIFYIQSILCLFVLINSLRSFFRFNKEKNLSAHEARKAEERFVNHKVLISIVLVILYVIFWDIIGYILSTFLFFAVESRILDKEKPLWKCVLIGLIVAGISYTVFGILFQVSFPEPLFEFVLG